MKITGPGSPPPPPDATGGASEAKGPAGKGFADAVEKGQAPRAVGGTSPVSPGDKTSPAGAVDSARLVADIGADLQAGRLTPQAAVDRVIDRILDQQLGANAPAAVRERVGAALRDALESDPLLADKMRDLAAAAGK